MTEDFLANLGNCGDMPEFRPQLASKICLLALKFDEDPKWQIETLVEILSMRSIDVSEETRNEFCQIVEKNVELHSFPLELLYSSLELHPTNEPLIIAGLYLFGELGHLLEKKPILELLETVATSSNFWVVDFDSPEVRQTCEHGQISTRIIQSLLNTMIKLSVRLPHQVDSIKKFLSRYVHHVNEDVQQRACEYLSFLDDSWIEARQLVFCRTAATAPAVFERKKDLLDLDDLLEN